MYSGTSIGGVKMTENEKRMRRVCFTGHRPEKLTRSENTIKRELEKQIRQAMKRKEGVYMPGRRSSL